MGKARAPWVAIRRQTNLFRRAVQQAIVTAHGGISLRLAKLERTAATAFESAQRLRRILSNAGEPGSETGLDHGMWLQYDTALQNREAACDKAIAALGLDRDEMRDVWDSIYRPTLAAPLPNAQTDGPADAEKDNAAESTLDGLEGKPAIHAAPQTDEDMNISAKEQQ